MDSSNGLIILAKSYPDSMSPPSRCGHADTSLVSLINDFLDLSDKLLRDNAHSAVIEFAKDRLDVNVQRPDQHLGVPALVN